MPPVHDLIRANNALWSVLYYDELIETPAYQLSFLAEADAGFYNCAQAVTCADAGVLAEIEAYYRDRGVMPAIYVDPAGPQDFAVWLAARGWVPVAEERENCHLLDLARPSRWPDPRAVLKIAPERVTIVHLAGPQDPLLDAFVAVDAAASELPPAIRTKLARNLATRRRDGIEVHCFVALVDGVVASTRLVGFAGELALYAEGGTLVEHRRCGLYAYLMLEGLQFARAAGKRHAFQTAGHAALSNPAVLALGFERIFSRAYHQLR